MNGDGLPDRVMDPKETYDIHDPNAKVYTNFVVEVNNGAGFDPAVKWTNVVPSVTGAVGDVAGFLAIERAGWVKMIDLNGDGLADRVMRGWQNQGTIPYTNFVVQFNTGGGFSGTNYFGPYYSQGMSNDAFWAGTDSAYARLLDINGDGLPDRVMGPRDPVSNGIYHDQRFTNFVVEFN
jgi:hypothetical protein